MTIPQYYVSFLERGNRKLPPNLVGSDFADISNQLKPYAIELLKEHGIANFLTKDDFVFMMHQGYIFWYFKADGNEDPEVYGYSEAEKQRRPFGPLSSFLDVSLR